MGHVRVAVIGAGFGGLGTAYRLREAGITDFVVLERGAAIGGTWRDNTYPGCACDVPSHLYSFSFARNPRWSRSFADQPEIRRYLEDITDRFDLRPYVRLNTTVESAVWSAADRRWELDTSTGPLTADIVVSATGPLSEPAVPDLPGLAGFGGEVFHSARWRHDLDLTRKRVAVVGTGASAIQFVPRIAEQVERLHLFQRTPPWIVPRPDRSYRPAEHRLFALLPLTQLAARAGIYAVHEAQGYGFFGSRRVLEIEERIARQHLHHQVRDPELRELLTPRYRMGCKRVLLSNEFYPALTRPNVEVIGSELAALSPTGVVAADGTERAVDAVIFGTGFHVTDLPMAERIRGRDGRTLAQVWADDGMQALRGTTVAGFPNLFLVIGPNTGQGHTSMIYVIESQLAYILDAIRAMDRHGLATLEPRPDAQRRWNDSVQRRLAGTVWTTGGCTSWYQDRTGRVSTLWPRFTFQFRRQTRAVDPAEYVADPRGDGLRAGDPDRRHTVRSADGTELNVVEYGPPDAPTVVLAHGWTCDSTFWNRQYSALAGALRVVGYDLRGHGRSAAPGPAGFTTDALADDLAAVLAATVPDGQKVVLGGHSMGAMTIVAFAERHPELLGRAVAATLLANTGVADLTVSAEILPLPLPVRQVLARTSAKLLAAPPRRTRGGGPDAISRRMIRHVTLARGTAPSTVDFIAEMITRCPPKVRGGFGAMLAELDLRDAVRHLTVPTTVIVGGADRLTPAAGGRRLAAALPRPAELIELPGIGHMGPVEAAPRVNAAIMDLVTDRLARAEER